MEKPTKSLAETRLLLPPAPKRLLLAPAKILQASLPQEKIDHIISLAKQGKSPKKIRTMTGVGITQIRRLTKDVEVGGADENDVSQHQIVATDKTTQDLAPEKKKVKVAKGSIWAAKPPAPIERNKLSPRFLKEARRLLGQNDEKARVKARYYHGPEEEPEKPPEGNEIWQVAARNEKRPAKEKKEHEEFKQKYSDKINGVYFMHLDGYSPAQISEATNVPFNHVMGMLFNRYTQDHFLVKNRKTLLEKYNPWGDGEELAMNNVLLQIAAGRIPIQNSHRRLYERKRPIV